MKQLRAEFDGRFRQLKASFLSERMLQNYESAQKDAEIARLRGLIDLRVVQQTLEGRVRDLHADLQHHRHGVAAALAGFQKTLTATVASILGFTKLLTQTRQDSEALEHSLEAMRHLVESGYALFHPMLTEEYKRGYHPWPLRLRNTQDPFSHVIKTQHGPSEVVQLREPIQTLNSLYLAIHRFVMGQIGAPDLNRPAYGRPLHALCSGIALSWSTSVNLLLDIRQRYQNELEYRRQMARINLKIMWNVYLQNVYSERSIKAIVDGNMNPYTTTLPVARRVNQFAAQRGVLAQERNAICKERMENARYVYRMWREKNIDLQSIDIPTLKPSNFLPALAERDSADNSAASVNSLSFIMSREQKRSSDAKSFSSVPLVKDSNESAESLTNGLDATTVISYGWEP
ncbi:unnamed protein product [Phytomonas sp. Hart1]|nr:unnamed protein product [Phytomonas sp. Hart1]|eukprot:CCW66807.1 unnamed protein product [Phytomonas sp. isolate Hart1]